MTKKILKMDYLNFGDDFDKENNFFSNFLREKYEIVISNKPDYVIASVQGQDIDALKYKDAIRICFAGENCCPDFNIYDYAIGYNYLTFGDRYIRFPLYRLIGERWEMAKKKHTIRRSTYEEKHTGFCNFVYSNATNVMPERDEILNLLDSYKKVDCGGKYRNNVGGPVADKIQFIKNYKFTIAVENTSSPGYTTEKLIDAWAAGTVPIYYGNPMIGHEFNSKAFVNCHDYGSLDEVLEIIKKLDSDPEAYARIMQEPIFLPDKKPDYNEELLYEFLSNIFDKEKELAFRRDRFGWGKVYEERLIKMYALKNHPIIKSMYKIYRIFNEGVKR